MTSKGFFILAISCMLLFLNSCKKEETIENTTVSEIEVSVPPQEPPAPPVRISPFDEFGLYKISDLRFYNAVTPFGAVNLSEDDQEARFYVPDMMSKDISKFLDNYFPYQRKQRYVRLDIFEVYPEILPEFKDDAIIPTTDPNIIKPTPETAVSIRVLWNQSKHYYEWIYHD
ncbi:MAG: hypothetical protein J6A01_08430, partial [Proteobacteria bacterium]|nr:hypothetical protein [Pseudomonadota bacterium]